MLTSEDFNGSEGVYQNSPSPLPPPTRWAVALSNFVQKRHYHRKTKDQFLKLKKKGYFRHENKPATYWQSINKNRFLARIILVSPLLLPVM